MAAGHVFVSYRRYMVLRLKLSATNLSPPSTGPRTKLTLQAVHELVALAEECEVTCTIQEASGVDCPQGCKGKSSTTCARSSRR